MNLTQGVKDFVSSPERKDLLWISYQTPPPRCPWDRVSRTIPWDVEEFRKPEHLSDRNRREIRIYDLVLCDGAHSDLATESPQWNITRLCTICAIR